MSAKEQKEPELPIEQLKKEVAALRKELGELKEREAAHWKKTENFLAKFGTYYNSTGEQSALFIINRFVNGGGANGIALTPQQGMIEQWALPVSLSVEDGKKFNSPFWIPEVIPEITEETIELFDEAESASGADNKAVS